MISAKQARSENYGNTLFSGGFGKPYFFIRCRSGCQIFGLIDFASLLQIAFLALVKILVGFGLRVSGVIFLSRHFGSGSFFLANIRASFG